MDKIVEEIEKQWADHRKSLEEMNGIHHEWTSTIIDFKHIKQVEYLVSLIKSQRESLLRMYDESYRLVEKIIETNRKVEKLKRGESLLTRTATDMLDKLEMCYEEMREMESSLNYKEKQIEYFSTSDRYWQQECGKLKRQIKELENRIQDEENTWDERL